MIVRRLDKADLPRVINLSKQLAREVEDPEPSLSLSAIEELAFGECPWFEALVVELGGEVVGFAAYTHFLELHTALRVLHVSDLVVESSRQRDGIGQVILDALLQGAASKGCHVIRLEVWYRNEPARTFYAKQGGDQLDEVVPIELRVERTKSGDNPNS